ncbi:retrovirus-related Pol polyprotein from transposon 297 [Trichonephila clavipes]|uniref:Retrovirus-related Pol polyprotein from transposon 297 n=1 Tax=Trichonephila clavipes TaxID=2585209 RepID=A0A8X6SBY3_TRICX|nr:retrovirus-related Pol polyprotein from transposon 297 [Trichonephila clavipes]
MALSDSLSQINLGVQGRALDWFEVLGYRVVEDKTTDYAHLKQALTEQFLVVMNRKIRGSSREFRDTNQTENNRFPNRNRQENWRERRGNNTYSDNGRPQREFDRFEGQGVADNRRFEGRRRDGQSDYRFHNQGGRQGGSRNGAFWEEVYRRYFSYRPRQKTKDRVVTAQGAPCCHLGGVELIIRIRDFQKTWEFHYLNNMQYQCILGIDFIKESKLTLDFHKKSLIIPDDQIKQLPKVEKPVEIDLSDTKLGEGQKQKLKGLFNSFKGLFSDQSGLTHVLYHEIDAGDQGLVVSRPYRYDRVKQGIIDHNIEKMLQEGKIRPIESTYASPVVLMRKNNGLPPDSTETYRFTIDYRKLNAITKYPRYPLPATYELTTNIRNTGIMSTLDSKSGYFQLAISPKYIAKTPFITRNGTFAFLRMPFVRSGSVPNFQKAIDIILKPVIGRFVMVYMDDVIITSPAFNEYIDHLNQVFTLLLDTGPTLNKDKCHFPRYKL